MRTNEEIQAEIQALEELKPKVPHYSAFGNDNHADIEIQIKVLKEGLDEDDVYDLELESDLEYAAMIAANWRLGQEDDSPSSGWSHVAK